MSKHSDTERKWMIEYLTPAVGCTITEVGVTEADEFGDAFPYLKIRRAATATTEAEEFTLEVSQDAEGNGPGHLFGLPSPGSSVTTIKLRNGMTVLAYEDGKARRYSKADAEKELKRVRGLGHNATIRVSKPSGDRYIAILEDDANVCLYCGEIPEDCTCSRGKDSERKAIRLASGLAKDKGGK